MGEIINGKNIAQRIRDGVKHEVAQLSVRHKRPPHLCFIRVGDDPASETYVRSKGKACDEVGINSSNFHLATDVSQEELEKLIHDLNNRDDVDAILVQLPVSKHLDTGRLLYLIDPKKDVDGFHPVNIGLLFSGGKPYAIPCTPLGVMALLDVIGCSISGKHAVVVGRSNIVGKPVSALLLQKHATVTICHSRTKELANITKTADILIAAVGQAKIITAGHVRPGAVVIDVGINRVDGKLAGDVDFESVKEIASYITPVPKGVGPMTIALLLSNTVSLFKQRR